LIGTVVSERLRRRAAEIIVGAFDDKVCVTASAAGAVARIGAPSFWDSGARGRTSVRETISVSSKRLSARWSRVSCCSCASGLTKKV
jgi:hypothetical protein